jgi:hypothetical protein
MESSWWESLGARFRSAWDVWAGRAYAGYSVPDPMSEVRLRIALLSIANNTCCDGCREAAKVAKAALDEDAGIRFTDPFQAQLS